MLTTVALLFKSFQSYIIKVHITHTIMCLLSIIVDDIMTESEIEATKVSLRDHVGDVPNEVVATAAVAVFAIAAVNTAMAITALSVAACIALHDD